MATIVVTLLLVAAALRWAYVEWWKRQWTKSLPRLQQVIGSSTPARGAEVVRDLHEVMTR